METVLPFSVLLYRYFFFEWLYRDAGHGDMFERAAAGRYNEAHAHWLLTYIRRWVVICVLTFGIASYCEQVLDWAVVAAIFYIPCVIGVIYNAVAGICWCALRFGWLHQRADRDR